jgi:hypothetical protein
MFRNSVILLLLLFSPYAFAVQQHGSVSEILPTKSSDTSQKQLRATGYGEMFVIPLTNGLSYIALEGQYFTAMTSTPGTAYNLTGATQTAWVATTPTFFLKNNASAGGKKVFMDFINLSIVLAGTGSTACQYAVVIDTGSRTTSAGTALTVANPYSAGAGSTITTGIVAGAVTASAATTPRYLYRGTLKNAALAIGDRLKLNFGGQDSASSTNTESLGPLILDGGATLLVYVWCSGLSAAPTGEVSAGWYER